MPEKIDELGLGQAFGHAPPVRQLEQLARGQFAAPIVAVPQAGRIGVDHGEAGEAAAHPQHQVARYALGRGERENGLGIGIIAERGRERGVDARAREVDRDVEGIAGAADAEAAVAAADEFDHRLPDRDGAGSLLAHGVVPRRGAVRAS